MILKMLIPEHDNAFDKSIIVDKARTGNIHVRFIKANGEERLMRCTLKNEHLPKQIDLEESNKRQSKSCRCVGSRRRWLAVI